jgi:UDP-N-acetyl-D-glucosamine dehydrogenase
LVVGVGYKKNVDDTRESPALTIMELLQERSADVSFYDPLLSEIPRTRQHPTLTGRRSEELSSAVVAGVDLVLICTDHDAIDYPLLLRYSKLILDTRNVFARLGLVGSHVEKA